MPFDNTADARFFFATPEHDEALAALRYGVTQRRGFTVVTGQPGCGKTLLGQMLIRSLGGRTTTAVVSHRPEDAHDLIATLCRGLGVRVRLAHSTGQLVERLHGKLVARHHEDHLMVAVIDEAQNLSVDLLEHLCMLGNLEQDTAKLLQIVLLGQPELVTALRDPGLEQLLQRIFCSRRIAPLTRDQTHHYVSHRLKMAQAKHNSVFDEQAIDLIYERSAGLPRLINQIADNSLLAAYGASSKRVDRTLVAEAITEMMEVQLGQPDRQEVPEPAIDPAAASRRLAAEVAGMQEAFQQAHRETQAALSQTSRVVETLAGQTHRAGNPVESTSS